MNGAQGLSTATALPRIAAVVVHHAGLDDTLRCLGQLAEAGVAAGDVVVVANGASAADRAVLRAARPAPRVVELALNVGFAAGANAGLAQAFGGGADAALLINPDVAFGPELVRELVGLPGVRDEVRMPEIFRADEPERTWFAGAWRGSWPGRWRRRRAGDLRCDVDVLWACCWLVGADAWRRVGLFDPGYFLYFEDVAWCDRARAYGVPLRVVPEARLAHAGGGSFRGAGAWAARRYWMSRGAVRYARERGGRAMLWRGLVDAALALGWLAAGRFGRTRAHLAGLRDGWRERRPIGASAHPASTTAVRNGPAEDAPRFTFIVASAHLPTTAAALRAILAQTASQQVHQVLVFGDSAPGGPNDARIAAIPHAPGPACAAYNAGLCRATGTHVVFVDADCLLAPDWLARVAQRHAEGWGAVAGGVVIPDGPRLAVAYNMAQFHGFLAGARTGPRAWLPTMNLSVDIRLAERAGPFRQDLARAYDVDWTLRLGRAGAALLFDGGLRASHHPCGITPEILERTWFAGGACSPAVRRAHSDRLRSPGFLDHARAIRAAAPFLAAAATARCAWRNRRDRRIWGVLGVVWRTKRAWCRGAAHAARNGPLAPADYGYRPVVAVGGATGGAPSVDAPNGGHDAVDVRRHEV